MVNENSKLLIAICDDNKQEQNVTFSLISSYLTEKKICFGIKVFISGEDLITALKTQTFDICFLDVLMQDKNGIETAYAIRQFNKDIAIIFSTKSTKYAVQSYDVNAQYYIVKPVTMQEIEKAFLKCEDILYNSYKFIEVICRHENIKIYVKNIIYAEVFGNQIVIHTQNGSFETYMSLDSLVTNAGGMLLRCHRSYAVNLEQVKKVVGRDFILRNSTTVPIRTNGRAEVIHTYNRYLTEKAR